jgi:hypothetical protein
MSQSQYEETVIRVCIGTGTGGPIYADLRLPTPIANLLSVLKQTMYQNAKKS